MDEILLTVDPLGIATITLNRPELHNAIDDGAADLLTAMLETLVEEDNVRIVLIKGNGMSFSAGHDQEHMRDLSTASETELQRQARRLIRMLATLDQLPKPTIACVQGPAFGIGAALVACCDIAIASSDALFSFADVRMGAIPAVAAPYVIRAIGERNTRRYFVTGERFNAGKAKRLGLIHQDVDHDEFDGAVKSVVEQLLLNGPKAMGETKSLISDLAALPAGGASTALTIERHARVRASDEGREGLLAFLEHRKPNWVTDEH
ncbi:enoyl-CoA hydratase-related protein [Crenobacter sp. SG2305]|uniref:enoyl-CoA hydratase-related protein n=1 Tax=Crenobacter oryzisoli TaxID=3056844 RepID=UPI0025AB3859|nr:enoyl-CoA hydratase-related protein [Crenobacter sp. SG2305]MDN0083255.1 enoyl-CoA hydratase-related protein [Crenobacter sp. SG2305]